MGPIFLVFSHLRWAEQPKSTPLGWSNKIPLFSCSQYDVNADLATSKVNKEVCEHPRSTQYQMDYYLECSDNQLLC